MRIPIIDDTRRNHALEHATIHVLMHRFGDRLHLMGRSASDGFYIYGDVPTQAVEEAVFEALKRLQSGESELAVSPQCGTNLAVAGVLAGLSSMLAMGSRRRPERLANVILAATGAIIAAQPIGRLIQKYLTTSSRVEGLRIKRIVRSGTGKWTVHKIETA